MSDDMLGVSLRDAHGPMKDLWDKLCGRNGSEWLRQLCLFLRREPPESLKNQYTHQLSIGHDGSFRIHLPEQRNVVVSDLYNGTVDLGDGVKIDAFSPDFWATALDFDKTPIIIPSVDVVYRPFRTSESSGMMIVGVGSGDQPIPIHPAHLIQLIKPQGRGADGVLPVNGTHVRVWVKFDPDVICRLGYNRRGWNFDAFRSFSLVIG
ncbi:MAG: hypothetical protein WC773_03185 [Patescibacteria group bacterium]|jgi:hypothetical protein